MFKVRARHHVAGRKLKARLRSDERKVREVRGTVISVGFHDKRMASLAAILEYGEPQTNLPERPAFRLTSRGDMLDKARAKLLEIGKRRARVSPRRRTCASLLWCYCAMHSRRATSRFMAWVSRHVKRGASKARRARGVNWSGRKVRSSYRTH